jgi:hypothetical protein
VPAGALAIDGLPGWLGSGQSGAMAFFDPTKGIARAVSLTSAANVSAINFTIKAVDIYGRPWTQTLAGPNATTVTTKKTAKFVLSVTPNTTSASTVSVGTSDIYGFPVRVDFWPYVAIFWGSPATQVTSATGFVAADTTSPATASTGDVRGTYATASASNGTNRLSVFVSPRLANVVGANVPALVLGLKGVQQV